MPMITPADFMLAIALAMDAFAVALASGVKLGVVHRRQAIRLSFSFGLFQFIMPIFGWYLGLTVRSAIERWDHWIAFGLLAFIGVKMLRESFEKDAGQDGCPNGYTAEKSEGKNSKDPTTGLNLLLLSIATSIDALAVGLSFAMLGRTIWAPAILIGITCALITSLGLYLGKSLSKAEIVGKRAELIGGLVLIGIGIKILLDHGALW